jgi:chemotaxis protein MotB
LSGAAAGTTIDALHDDGTDLFPPRRPNRWALPLTAVAAVGIAGGTGYYAFRAAGERDEARGELTGLRAENRALSDALELHRASKVELGAKLEGCEGALTTEKSTRVESDALLASCQSSVKDLEQQKAQARAMLRERDSLAGQLRKMIDSGRLEVELRRGQLVVKLPAQVLFPSGSAVLSKDGEEAVAEVARVLKAMPRQFTVAGHTDNVPVKNADFDDNWELSTARAVTVTSVLIDRGVKPARLVAAGYGEHAPIASNASEAGRRRNRRIEIILEPDLGKLPITQLEKKSRAARSGHKR